MVSAMNRAYTGIRYAAGLSPTIGNKMDSIVSFVKGRYHPERCSLVNSRRNSVIEVTRWLVNRVWLEKVSWIPEVQITVNDEKKSEEPEDFRSLALEVVRLF